MKIIFTLLILISFIPSAINYIENEGIDPIQEIKSFISNPMGISEKDPRYHISTDVHFN